MNGLVLSATLDFKYILVIVITLAVLVTLAIVLTIFHKKKKGIKIDEDYVRSLLKHLGGKGNISVIGIEGRKLKVEVNDLSVVNLEAIKELAQTGIFVSGNNIKALFKYDADELNKGLKIVIKE